MRPYFLNIGTWLLIGLLVAGFRPALISWVTVNETVGRCQFSFPAGYAFNSTSDVALYTVTAENITFEMHYVGTSNITSVAGQSFQTNITTMAPADRYSQFASTMVAVTSGTLVQERNVVQSNQQGREVEVTYNEVSTDQPSRIITQFYWLGNNLYAFTASAPTSIGQQALYTAKNTMANSIQFY